MESAEPAFARPKVRRRVHPAVEASIASASFAVLKGPTAGISIVPSDAKPRPLIERLCTKKSFRRSEDEKTQSKARVRNPEGRCSATVSRASSSSVPYSTPEGHTGSHARHPRHRSMCVPNASEPGSSRPSTTARMRCRRPRGESASSPRRLYVGHAGRQNPQCTHGSKRSRCFSSASESVDNVSLTAVPRSDRRSASRPRRSHGRPARVG